MRLFAGIFPPKEVIGQIGAVAAQVKCQHANAILVKPEKIHLTIRFFGRAELEATTQILEIAVKGFSRFEVTLDHVDAFPNRKLARVVFCGIREPTPLTALMFAAGQRRPHPHLTLARLATTRTVKKEGVEPIVFTAKKVSLVNSVLGKDSKYEVLREWTLD